MIEAVSGHLAANILELRQSRGFSQAQCSKIAGIPRPTWSNLESGQANPTIHVLVKVAAALQVTVEEILRPPRALCQFYEAASLRRRKRGGVIVRELLPDNLVGIQIERLELEPNAILKGNPHTPGTREYLTCEIGHLELNVAGQRFELKRGDVVVFLGDQKHSYKNKSHRKSVAYSVILLDPSQLAR